MPSICRGGFVENAWRKDLCSNCFRTREEHADGMTSGFYQQPSWTHQASVTPQSVAIQFKGSAHVSQTVSTDNGLSPPDHGEGFSATSRHQSLSVGGGLHTVGNHIPVRTTNNMNVGCRNAQTSGPAAIGSRINALYSDRVLPSPRSGGGATSMTGGINVTVNGTSSNNMKKYVKQHSVPPQAAVRTSIPATVGNRVPANNTAGVGVSVSVGRSTSYSSHLNTVAGVGAVRSNGSASYNRNNGNKTGNNYGNSTGTNGSHHYHQQRRTAHSQPPTHQLPNYNHQENKNSSKSSSVPVMTHSKTSHLQSVHHNCIAHTSTSVKQLTSVVPALHRDPRQDMDVGVTANRLGLRSCGVSCFTTSCVQTKSCKGILKREGLKRKMSVTFPQEVCAVIGFGGECNLSDEESEEEVPFDPLDTSTIPEIMEKNATSPTEKELNRITVKNTNFNAVKTNLLGLTAIELGPIVGRTGGKSVPVVSIGTFESRKEPHHVLRKVSNDDPTPSTFPKNLKVANVGNPKPVPLLSSSIVPTSQENESPRPNNNDCISLEIQRNETAQNQEAENENRVSVHNRGKEASVTFRSHQSTSDIKICGQSNVVQVQHQFPSQPVSIAGQMVKLTPPSLACAVLPAVSVALSLSQQINSVSGPSLKTEPSPFYSESLTLEALVAAPVIKFPEKLILENCINERLPCVSLPHDSLEPARILKSELKLEQSSHFQASAQYEEDSLEADSGLDTNPSGQIQTSESDTEKSGSNSDSGNENDFMERLQCRTGLFVSIDSDEAPFTSKKPAELSPDSVISSEMSSTSPADSGGSNESIPQKLSEEGGVTVVPIPKLNNATIPPSLKRTAPLPPVLPLTDTQVLPRRTYSTEDLYDDVHLSGTCPHQEHIQQDLQESIYDDCGTIGNARMTKGSYDFTDGSGGIDPGFGEGVPLKQYPGIEFLGIRKIDSESFLEQQTPPQEIITSKIVDGKKARPAYESPKQKRRVNQFFSTIGKKAGAAFRSTNHEPGVHDPSSPLKSGSMKTSSTNLFLPYKRSMSTDEVSMTRTQELYATLTPTTLKLRGLTPVLNKLSKFEFREPKEDSAEKKKNKFSMSIRKFLGFGVGKSSPDELDLDAQSGETRNSVSKYTEWTEAPATSDTTASPIRPPPPPPRVHSLDTSAKPGTVSMKPARPPPPKVNQVAPSFVSVFAGLEDEQGLDDFGQHDFHSPPNKPRRKASICRTYESCENGAYTANYLETTYNHITSLNFETLKLIASQAPAKIKRASNQLLKMNKNPLKWSQFYVTDVENLAFGQGYAFFSAFWEDEPCVLLLQESLSCGVAPLEFDCIEVSASFEDIVQLQFVPWESSDFVNTSNGVKVYISVLAACTVQKLPEYINNGAVSPSRKFYALLQAMDFWGKEDLSDMVVFHKTPTAGETVDESCSSSGNKSKSSPSPNFGLVYVVGTRIKMGSNRILSYHPARDHFDGQIQKFLFGNSATVPLLVENDKEILQRRLEGSTTEEVQAQLRLFLQLKLFGPRSGDLDKILRYRSERQVTQWMDKERAFCMNDALKRSLERNSEPMSPLRKSFVEFLMISDNCAKTILHFIVDLYPDV